MANTEYTHPSSAAHESLFPLSSPRLPLPLSNQDLAPSTASSASVHGFGKVSTNMSWTPPFNIFQTSERTPSSSTPSNSATSSSTPSNSATSRSQDAAPEQATHSYTMTSAALDVPFEVSAPAPRHKTQQAQPKSTKPPRKRNSQDKAQPVKTTSPNLAEPLTPVTPTTSNETLNAAPTITLPVTLGALELSFADGQSQQVNAASSEALPEGPLDHHQAAQAVGISPALLACYVSIFRSLGGRLEYSAEDLRTNKHALQPRYDQALIEGFKSVRAQVRAGADIRSAMAVVTSSRVESAESKTSKSKSKRKGSTAKLEALSSVNASLSKEIAALQAELDNLKGGRSNPFSA